MKVTMFFFVLLIYLNVSVRWKNQSEYSLTAAEPLIGCLCRGLVGVVLQLIS